MVIRVEKTSNYTVMSNHHLRDKSLTLKAKGLLSLVLSLPDSWNYSIEGLAEINKEGVSAVRSALKELETAGYVSRKRVRDEKGLLRETEYTFCEHPACEKPKLENPTLENRTQINKDPLSTDCTKYSPTTPNGVVPPKGEPTPKRERKRFTPPKLEEVEAYCRSRQNGIDASKFIDYYESVGWKVGKQPMKDWKAAVRTWERRDASNASSQAKKEEAYRAPVCVGFDEEGRGIYK